MMTAERWVQQQESRNRYDFDVRPKVGREKRKKEVVSAKDKSRVLLLMMVAGLICLGIIVTSAYGAAVNYNNNQIKESNKALQGEVDTLKIQIQGANNIATIETKALNQGMVYPEGDRLVVVSGKEKPKTGFSVTLKEQAYR